MDSPQHYPTGDPDAATVRGLRRGALEDARTNGIGVLRTSEARQIGSEAVVAALTGGDQMTDIAAQRAAEAARELAERSGGQEQAPPPAR